MRTNALRQRLYETDDLLLGIFVTLRSAAIVEMAGLSGLDFVIIDMEHTNIDEADLEDMARAGWANGISVVVRIRDKQPATILRVMEAGVDGLLIPQVDSAEQAEQAVRAAYYAPRGARGVSSLSRAAGFGFGGGQPDPVCAVQIESKASIDEIEAILAVPMVDVAFIGPSDLRNSLVADQGSVGGVDETLQTAIERAVSAIGSQDVPFLGVPATHPSVGWDQETCVSRGARFVTLGADVSTLAGGLKAMIAPFCA